MEKIKVAQRMINLMLDVGADKILVEIDCRSLIVHRNPKTGAVRIEEGKERKGG